MKERNLTLSPRCQDSPQGVLIPRAMEVTTHFAIKPTKKKKNSENNDGEEMVSEGLPQGNHFLQGISSPGSLII